MDFVTEYNILGLKGRMDNIEKREQELREAGRLMVDALELIRKKVKTIDECLMLLNSRIDSLNERIDTSDGRIVELEEMHACTNRQPFTWAECDMPEPIKWEDLNRDIFKDEEDGHPPCMRCDDHCLECEFAAECPIISGGGPGVPDWSACDKCNSLDACLDHLY